MRDVTAFLNAVEAFWAHLAAVAWAPLGVAVALHVLRLSFRARGWQNILRAAYPDRRVAYGGIFGSYVAGVGVNSLAPARGGDLIKLYLAKRRVPGSAYPTLGSTLLAETLFDFFVAGAIFLWALQRGILPGVPDLPALPAFDWRFVIEHPRLAAIVGSVLLAAIILGFTWASRHVRAFWARVRQGLVILTDLRAYLFGVVWWQALSWVARVAAVFFFLSAFHIDATLSTALSVIVVQSLATLLPFTPGGVGTTQAVLVYVLAGTAASSAILGFSVGMQLVTVAVNVALGFGAIAIMLRTLRWRRRMSVDEPPLTQEAGGERAPAPSG